MEKQDSLALGWGRAAALRFVKSEEEIKADIIKALEGKLSVEFQDYSQWQRVPTETETSITTRPSTKTTLKPKSLSSGLSSSKITTVSSGCSSLCIHPWNKKEPPIDKTAEEQKNKRVVILKTQIAAKKRSVLEYMKLRKMLRTSNQSLKKDILKTEENSHREVTDLLEKFEKYTSAAITLADKHKLALNDAKIDFQTAKDSVDESLTEIETDRLLMDEKIQNSENDLQVLRTYKDKVYPEKALTIAKLQNSIQNLLQDQKNKEKDLNRIIRGERGLLDTGYNYEVEKVIEKAAEDALEFSPAKCLDGIYQSNISLIYEIKIQQNEILKIEREIANLNAEINQLRSAKARSVKKYVFPEVFFQPKKCSPDEEIILDIPTRQFLPI